MFRANSIVNPTIKEKRTKKSDFHDDFVQEANIKLDTYIRELHLAFEKRAELANIIDKNKYFYDTIGVDINVIYNYDSFDAIKYTEKQYETDLLKMSFVKSYNQITKNKIRDIQKNIKIYNVLRKTPYSFYVNIQKEYNIEAGVFVLKGNPFTIGEGLGVIKLDVYPNPNGNMSTRVDWKSSLKLKEELIKNGYEIKSDENPNGMPYILYYDNLYVIARLYWQRRNSDIFQKYFYKLHFYQNHNFPLLEQKYDNIEDIFYDRRLSLMDRMCVLNVNYPEFLKQLLKK